MQLSRNEIRTRALAFAKKWAEECSEAAEAKSFWDEFFHVFGISRKRVASFEEPVKKLGNRQGFIDLFWKGRLLVEHKSRGHDLDKAFDQALDYFPGLAEHELPRFVLVSDFARFRLHDLEERTAHEFVLADLHKNIHLFHFISGYRARMVHEQDPVNIQAAELMGQLHDRMKDVGYEGHPLEIYLVRLLFCLFAEDSGIFEIQQFQDFLEQRTQVDGSDLGGQLAMLFQALNTPKDKRLRNLDEDLADFAYINGHLFSEALPLASFDSAMRDTLLKCCTLDWGYISPAIFGSLFQSIMDKTARRNLGAHYTSEENILKVLGPLFLDDLHQQFERARGSIRKLTALHNTLRSLTFLDPACGCGNFLVIAYRELRRLELQILLALHGSQKERQLYLDVSALVRVNVDQFYGIEIEEFPAQIAQVALWLMDHQMNQMVSEEFGLYFVRIPLRSSPNIICANALTTDWNEIIPAQNLSYIFGNPPFVGAKFLQPHQRADVEQIFSGINKAGLLDYVAAWYVKAAKVIQDTAIRCAFVSTNSITQGEQVGVLWSWMLKQNMNIFFAHRTFAWSSEARGKAAVHCVVIGFAQDNITPKTIFEYPDIKGKPQGVRAKNINPYLLDAPNIIIQKRSKPISNIPLMSKGNQPTDGGHLILTVDEREKLLELCPETKHLTKRLIGAKEFLHGTKRYCLWLVHATPQELKRCSFIMDRIEKCRKFRAEEGIASDTIALAATPTVFRETRNPDSYVVIPSVSSERRNYVPMGFETSNTIATNLCLVVNDATLYHFGILSSLMHNAWMRAVAGRLESRYRYSAGIVYNTFPWPKNPTDKQKQAIENAAQAVLDARALFPESSLADLYDPLTMPPMLLKAHHKLDKAVDAAYGRSFASEADRVAFLFALYGQYVGEGENG
ncbi:N-6 DNA methylase [Desulfovibrionales bacterium]